MMLLLLACRPDADDGGKPDTTEDPGPFEQAAIEVEAFDATSDRDGYVKVPVEVEAGDVFQVVVTRDDGNLSTDYLYDPDGNTVLDWEYWYDSADSLTDAFYAGPYATTVNWPIRAEDGPTAAGTWEAWIATLTDSYDYVSGKDVHVEVIKRHEGGGKLRALVAYAGGLEEDADVVAATEAAAAYWKEIYGEIGVDLDIGYATVDVGGRLQSASAGNEAFEELLAAQDERYVLVVVGNSITGSSDLYGEAAAIPGPYAPTPLSVVEVGWLANAGADATFQDSEVRLMGETMAHEVGHFLGLFHPVEQGWTYWDALDDTPSCDSARTCETDLAANLMYPYPVCSGSNGTCVRQNELTAGQAGIVTNYVGVR